MKKRIDRFLIYFNLKLVQVIAIQKVLKTKNKLKTILELTKSVLKHLINTKNITKEWRLTPIKMDLISDMKKLYS